MNALISSPDRGGSLTAGGVLFGYRQCRHQPDHAFGRKRSSHQTGRRAALEQRGQPCSRTERCEAVEECLREKANADRDRTLEWSRFGPCEGPKSSKAMPPHQVEENERTHRRVASAASCLDFLRRTQGKSCTQRRSGQKAPAPSVHHAGKRWHIGLQHHQPADKAGKRDGMPEHEAQDRAFVAKPVCRGRGHDNRLGVDHLAHDAAG
jgi:hypothetical protein